MPRPPVKKAPPQPAVPGCTVDQVRQPDGSCVPKLLPSLDCTLPANAAICFVTPLPPAPVPVGNTCGLSDWGLVFSLLAAVVCQ